MKMHKIVILLVLLSFLLGACSSAAPTSAPPVETQAPLVTEAPPPTNTPQPPTPTPEPPTPTPEPEVDEFAVVAAYINERFANWAPVITADKLFENLTDGDDTNNPFIIDVRKPEDYARGHIQGAVNVFWNEIVKPEVLAALPKDRLIVTYCYTGHTGEAAATILHLLGYTVTNLKYGMMGWTPDEEIVGQPGFKGGAGYQVETEPHELPEADATKPSFKTGNSEAVEIILARAQELFPKWSPVITADKLFENLADGDDANNPFIIDVRKPEDYARGHVSGAVNVFWTGIAAEEVLVKLPSDQQIVTYCYTGHTGEAAAVALMLLGYDVTNLKFAIMGWTDDEEVVGQPIFAAAADYAVEAEPHPFP